MPKYLDEFNPTAKARNYRVQSDDDKLIFLNVLSCAALVVVPVGSQTMSGAHIQVTHGKVKFDNPEDKAKKLEERAQILRELREAAGPGALDAYMVCAWAFYSQGTLPKDLKKFARNVFLCDVPPFDAKGEARIDVMVKMLGNTLQAYIRNKAEMVLDAKRQPITKPGWNFKTAEPGMPFYKTDENSKPWMPVQFTRLV